MSNKNKKYLIITIFTIAIIFFGGTLAYWQWETSTGQQTQVTFTVENNFKCSVDGGGDITSSNITLAPSTCTNSKYAIKRKITTDVEITGSNMSVLMDLWLDVNSIDPELKNSTNFKYAITTNSNSCTNGYIDGGTFTGTTAELLTDKIYSTTKEDTYYLYIWLDSEETNPNTQNKTFSLSLNGSCTSATGIYKESILTGADPILEQGMIPVVIADNGDVTTADLTQEWYKYEDKQWANAVLVSSNNRMNYYNTDGTIKGNHPVTESDILAYYVWIPKYSYKMNGTEQPISISFNTTPSGYNAHPAFTFGDTNLNGFWVGKFETTGTGESTTILPNDYSLVGTYGELPPAVRESLKETSQVEMMPNYSSNKNNITNLAVDYSLANISDFFEVSLKFAGGTQSGNTITFVGNNTYGLTANTNSHMMKNSEWGAVAYLSHSEYGIEEEIRINNNKKGITGCGALNKNGTYTLECQIEYGKVTEYPQSTTGNISGIFDMSGGTDEYVMGNYNGLVGLSGFSILPEIKYYDLYNITSISTCTLETCGGHSLHETAGWYSDTSYFVETSKSWFYRGGSYSDTSAAGIFQLNGRNGTSQKNTTFRLVITKES